MDYDNRKEGLSLLEQYEELMKGHSFDFRDEQSLEQPYPYRFVDSVTTNHVIVNEDN